jgi:hypothetical protein
MSAESKIEYPLCPKCGIQVKIHGDGFFYCSNCDYSFNPLSDEKSSLKEWRCDCDTGHCRAVQNEPPKGCISDSVSQYRVAHWKPRPDYETCNCVGCM